jgi:type I restriction enzyme S subunit
MSQISVEGIDTSVVNRWKRYPAYKDSGVEWLGEIPAHWEVKQLKFIAYIQSGVAKGRDLGGRNIVELPYLRVANVQDGYLDLSDIAKITVGKDEVERYLLRAGDVLMNEGGDYDKLGRGAVWQGQIERCIHQNHVYAVRPHKGIDPYWINTVTLTSYAKHYFILKSKQSTNLASISSTNLKELPVVIPPVLECKAIASFLDRETAKIDALIAKKERLIELLQEKRTAIISHAVTKGLDPTVPLEDSGVDWLGEVPTHWEVKRIKYLAIGQDCGIQMGPFGGMLKDLSVEETGFKVYGQENTINDDFTAGHRWITYKQLLEMARYTVRKGDLLLTRKGSIGKCRVVPDDVIPGIIDSDTIRVRVNEDWILKSFLVRLMHEAWYLQEQIVWNSRGAILTGLNTTTIAELRVAVPPLSEQKEIVAYLDRETAKIDALIAKIREGIEKLKEYRTALISAAVTGKIDVRNEVAS